MALKQTAAVVLDVIDHGESDKIVTFYCAESGRLSGIAKGAKRSKKRFMNKLEIFSWLEIFYDEKRKGSLVRIDEAELVDSFVTLRQNYDRYVPAALICELMVCWTRENNPDEDLFPLLVWALHNLDIGLPPPDIAIFFHIKLFALMGYQPHLTGCTKCGCFDASGAPFTFSLGRNGLVCVRCRKGSTTGSMPLSLNTAKLLKNVQDLPLDKLSRLRFSAVSTTEALSLAKRYCQHILQREIHSWEAFKLNIR